MTTLRVLPNDRSHTFRQPIKSAAHVRRFAGHPDPRSLRAIHRLQTRQPHHPVASAKASNARTWSASNPGPTIKLRPFGSRISTRGSLGLFSLLATCTSTKGTGGSARHRFLWAKKYEVCKLRSRQNSATLCPLRACSWINFCHFTHVRFVRCVIPQHCYAWQSLARWGSFDAHILCAITLVEARLSANSMAFSVGYKHPPPATVSATVGTPG